MSAAPVVLFAYRRVDHLQKAVQSLAANALAAKTPLYVFSDGPKGQLDEQKVAEVREYLAAVTGFKAVQVFAAERNRGLSESIISGVGRILDEHDRVIVLEDDLIVSPYFLQYMNDSLSFYQDDERVVSVHGYTYPVEGELPETFFLRGADCWGWGTWRRGWQVFDSDGAALLEAIKRARLERGFNLDNSFNYLQILKDQVEGRNDSWAIRWHAAAYLAGKLTLYPGRSLVQNAGTDASGTHFRASTTRFDTALADRRVEVHPIEVEESGEARALLSAYYRRTKGRLPGRLYRRVARIVRKDIPDGIRSSLTRGRSR